MASFELAGISAIVMRPKIHSSIHARNWGSRSIGNPAASFAATDRSQRERRSSGVHFVISQDHQFVFPFPADALAPERGESSSVGCYRRVVRGGGHHGRSHAMAYDTECLPSHELAIPTIIQSRIQRREVDLQRCCHAANSTHISVGPYLNSYDL